MMMNQSLASGAGSAVRAARRGLDEGQKARPHSQTDHPEVAEYHPRALKQTHHLDWGGRRLLVKDKIPCRPLQPVQTVVATLKPLRYPRLRRMLPIIDEMSLPA
jgi:hypothetical protein